MLWIILFIIIRNSVKSGNGMVAYVAGRIVIPSTFLVVEPSPDTSCKATRDFCSQQSREGKSISIQLVPNLNAAPSTKIIQHLPTNLYIS